MSKRKIVVLLTVCLLVITSTVQASSLLYKLQQIGTVIEKLSRLETTEVVQVLTLFESKAETGFNTMFDLTERTNLESKGVEPATLQAALAAFRTQYATAFPQKITTDFGDLVILADILENIRAGHFEIFREAAKTDGKLELDIFVELLLVMGTLEELQISDSLSTTWFNTLVNSATDSTAATNFLSDHGIRISKLNAFFAELGTADHQLLSNLLQKANTAPLTGGGGGGTTPVQETYNYTADTTEVQNQIDDPNTTEITIALPEITAAEKTITLSSELITNALAAEKPFVLSYGTLSFTLPPGFIPASTVSGTDSISLTISEVSELPASEDMVKRGQVFEFSLTSTTGNQQTSITTFATPVTVTIPVSDMDLTTVEMEKLGLYRYSGSDWSYIGGTTNKQTLELSAQLAGFSSYRVMLYNKTFTDITTHWAKRTIELLASRHLVVGMTQNVFAPESSLTRAQTATLLVRTLGLKATSSNTSFSDVGQTAWYYSPVHTAAQAGLIFGYPDGTFKPDQIVSREEFAAMVVRAARYAGQTETLTSTEITNILADFSDNSTISNWARADMAYTVHMGLIGGFPNNTIQPTGTSTRAQGTTILERLLRKLNKI